MKKHTGFALPTAIGICLLLLIVSMGVSSMIILSASLNKVTVTQADFELIYKASTNEFVAADESELDDTHNFITDTTFQWETYQKGRIWALVAESGATVRFYAIYDFENADLLAYQSSNFYVTTDGEGIPWLGGLVKYTGGGL